MKDFDRCLTDIHAHFRVSGQQAPGRTDKHSLLLYYHSCYTVYRDDYYAARLTTLLKALVEALSAGEPSPATLLMLPLLADLRKEYAGGELLDGAGPGIDYHLYKKAMDLALGQNLGYVNGLAGILNYFLGCLPNRQVESYLNQLLPPLLQAFTTRYALKSNYQTSELGLATGISGILLVLIKAYQKGFEQEAIRKILKSKILEILARKEKVDFAEKRYAIFPNKVVGSTGEAEYTRKLSWGSSDLNQSLLFHQAYEVYKDEDLRKMADVIGLNTLLRQDQEATDITGSSFLEGSSGVAQTYLFLYSLSGHQAYRKGYDYWIERTVALLTDEMASGAYLNREADLLNGLLGPALTLLSCQAGRPLAWSRCVLL